MSDLHQLAIPDLASKNLEQGGLARAWRAQQQTHAPLHQTAPALLGDTDTYCNHAPFVV